MHDTTCQGESHEFVYSQEFEDKNQDIFWQRSGVHDGLLVQVI